MSTATEQLTATDHVRRSADRRTDRRAPADAQVAVALRSGRSVVARAVSAMPLGVRELVRSGPHARVALVQTAAMLISGDEVSLDVLVGAGATLELSEISGTVAYPSAGGAGASMRVNVELEAGARLAWSGQPLIVSAGAEVTRSTFVSLQADARLLMRDTIVLGRHGEPAGRVVAHTRVERESRPVLHETLDLSEPARCSSEAILGEARVIDSLAVFGHLPERIPDDAFRLGESDALLRRLTTSAAHSDLDAIAAGFADHVLSAA